MARIALGLEYDGTDFIGWQVQRAGRSVQAALQAAVSRVADQPTTIAGSGRTDAGVHALQQVAHFDTDVERSSRQWILGINSNLPEDVAVRWAHPVDSGFDARRSALFRRYHYAIVQSATRPAVVRRMSWWLREHLDCAAMTAAGISWLGENDFSAFRSAGCQSRTPMRRLISFSVFRRGHFVVVEFTANAFLQHMVRNLVGVLVEIGQGKAPVDWAREVLRSRDRTQGGVTAPPHGLSLVEVGYPARDGIPAAPEGLLGVS